MKRGMIKSSCDTARLKSELSFKTSTTRSRSQHPHLHQRLQTLPHRSLRTHLHQDLLPQHRGTFPVFTIRCYYATFTDNALGSTSPQQSLVWAPTLQAASLEPLSILEGQMPCSSACSTCQLSLLVLDIFSNSTAIGMTTAPSLKSRQYISILPAFPRNVIPQFERR